MTLLSIRKPVQVISSDSRQMRKNAQIADRPTDRQTDRGQVMSRLSRLKIYCLSLQSLSSTDKQMEQH